MPGKWLYIDTNFPTFTGEESTKEQIDEMVNYLFILVEQLKYSLNNLDTGNFNSKALSDWAESNTSDIVEQIVTVTAQVNTLNNSLQRLTGRVSALEGLSGRMNDAEDAIGSMQQTILSHTDSLGALSRKDTEQDQRLDALELWKGGAATDLSSLRTDVNSAAALANANAQDIQTIIAEIAQLKTSISVDDNGNAIFGKSGQRTDIKGDVYINNLPYVTGGNS